MAENPKQLRPQDWYLRTLLRLDRLSALVNALNEFYAAPTEAQTRAAVDHLQRIAQRHPLYETAR